MVIANKTRSAELAIIISHPTSATEIIVLSKTPTKYREFFPTLSVKTTHLSVKTTHFQLVSSLVKMDKLWNDQTISFGEKLRLLRSIVISVLLYGCESWTYKEELVKKINAFQFKCYRRLLGISWRYRRTNESVNQWKNRWETLPEYRNPTLKLHKNGKWNYSAMSQFRLANTIMHGWFPGNRGRGRPRRCWITDIRE